MKNKLKFRWLNEIEDIEKDLKNANYNSNANNKIIKKIEIFELGFLIFNLCLMNVFEDFLMNYVCPHEKNKKEKFCCCLYHCIEKYEMIHKKDSKIKITNFVNNSRYTEYFLNFLCLTMSYKNDLNFSYKKVKDHIWLKKKDKINMTDNSKTKNSILLELQEILKVSQDIKIKKEFTKFERIKKNSVFDNKIDDSKISEHLENNIINNFCDNISLSFNQMEKENSSTLNKIKSADQIFRDEKNFEEIENNFDELTNDLKISNKENLKSKIYHLYKKFLN
jgi:hypothetical protein